MSKASDRFTLSLANEGAELASKQAISDLGWAIEVAEPARIVPRVGVGITRTPAKIEVLVDDGDPATICLNGRITGIGPLQRRHLIAEMNKLKNAIEVAAQKLGR
jgi:hypothetical protein